MSILRHFKRIQFIDYLICKKATGSPEVFARKNRLSKRGLMLVLQEMREMGFPLKYDRTRNSYYYEEDGEMVKCLFLRTGQKLSRQEAATIINTDANNLCFSDRNIFAICKKD